MSEFAPLPSLVPGRVKAGCRAVVILPARNEEEGLPAALDGLARQAGSGGFSFEVIVLLNNCTDGSAGTVREWGHGHPQQTLHVVERSLQPAMAHVGTARRMLMDTAWRRLRGSPAVTAILSTDADTVVARDWVAENLAALERGADAVGGVIQLKSGALQALPQGARRAYLRDRRYQALVAELESLLDPQKGDPWPRHLEHFGASLGCTPAIYAKAGGLPAVKPLEDVAFVGALRRVDATLRHEPRVVVYTSSRLQGRAEVGLSGQLSIWQGMCERGEQHCVPTAGWLIHRFRTLRALRAGDADGLPQEWRERMLEVRANGLGEEAALEAMDCERLIAETFRGRRENEVAGVNRALGAVMRRLKR